MTQLSLSHFLSVALSIACCLSLTHTLAVLPPAFALLSLLTSSCATVSLEASAETSARRRPCSAATCCCSAPRRLRALIDRESCILCHPQIPGARSAGTWTRHQSREEIGPKKWTKSMWLLMMMIVYWYSFSNLVGHVVDAVKRRGRLNVKRALCTLHRNDVHHYKSSDSSLDD